MLLPEGYSVIFWEYNAAGRITKETYLDVNDFSVVLKDGTAWAEYEYDSLGQLTDIVRYDARGNRLN